MDLHDDVKSVIGHGVKHAIVGEASYINHGTPGINRQYLYTWEVYQVETRTIVNYVVDFAELSGDPERMIRTRLSWRRGESVILDGCVHNLLGKLL